MAMTIDKIQCFICKKAKNTYNCKGCSKDFCFNHLTEHRQTIDKQFDEIENDRNLFLQTLIERKEDPRKYSLIKQINQWEETSINKIKQIAEENRQIVINYMNKYIIQIENKLIHLTEQLKQTRQENEFNEKHLNQFYRKLIQLKEEIDKPPNISIQEKFTSFINEISVIKSFNTKWKQYGITTVGRNDPGNKLNQFSEPRGIFIDDDQTIYIADSGNNRIVSWKCNLNIGDIVAGGNQNNQLSCPTDIIVDKQDDSFIISDRGNRRVIRWPRQNNANIQVIISDIDCQSLTMDNKNEYLYVSDWKNDEVKRWNIKDKSETVVAGGNGKGDHLNQLNCPTYIFVDQDDSLYVSDNENNRVMKWLKDTTEGIIVAGGNGRGDSLSQLSSPRGIIVNQFGQIYVADMGNNRIIRWFEGANEGTIAVGGNGKGEKSNQFNGSNNLSFDQEGNLYVVDYYNNRIQKFEIDLH